MQRLDELRRHGPADRAFTFTEAFPRQPTDPPGPGQDLHAARAVAGGVHQTVEHSSGRSEHDGVVDDLAVAVDDEAVGLPEAPTKQVVGGLLLTLPRVVVPR